MLEDIKRSYIICADANVPNWRTANKNDLINEYVNNEHIPALRDGYFSAIILRYWGNIGKHYLNSKASGFTIEECYDMIIDAITYILKKRKWRDPSSPYYVDKNAPDKMINRTIYSARQLRYYLSNRDKRKANYGKGSLDQIQELVGDHTNYIKDYTEDIQDMDQTNTLDFDLLLSSYAKNNKLLSLLILHSIYFDDCFTSKKVKDQDRVHQEYSFKLSRLVTNLLSYDKQQMATIASKYDISEDSLNNTLEKLKSVNKNRAGTIIKKVIEELSSDKELKEFLC